MAKAATKEAEPQHPFVSGFCEVGNCHKCRGTYDGRACACPLPTCAHKNATANTGEGDEAPAAEAMPDATATSGEVQGQTIPADAGAELTPNGEGPGSIAEATAVATSAAPDPNGSAGGGDSEGRDHEPVDAGGVTSASEAPAGGVHFDELPIEWIVPAPDNVRRDLGDLSGLVESIKANGVLEPLVVAPCDEPDGADHRYHLVAGERRWTAARDAGLREVPAMVRDAISDDVRVELMLVENLQRKDLDPLEEADGYRRLADLGRSQRQIAARVGCTQAHVSHRMSLLELAPKVRDAIAAGKVSVTEAREFGKLDDHKRQEAALKEAKKTSYGGGELGAEWAVAQQLREAKAAEKKAAIEAEAKKKGWSILERGPRDYSEKGYKRLVKETWEGGLHVDPKAHRKEPCHALLIDNYTGDPRKVEVCTAPARHAAKGESEVKEPQPEKRPLDARDKREREEAKAKKAAGARRVEFLTERLTKKVGRDKALELVCEALLHRAEHEAKKHAVKFLGLDGNAHTVVDAEAKKSTDDLVRSAVAVALATGEAYARASWTSWESAPVRSLYRFLADEGYELDEFEQGQLGKADALDREAQEGRARMLELVDGDAVPEAVRMVLEQKIREAPASEILEFLEEAPEQAGPTLTWWFQVCRECGCTEEHGCAEGCTWVEDDLCSSCAAPTGGDNGEITEAVVLDNEVEMEPAKA